MITRVESDKIETLSTDIEWSKKLNYLFVEFKTEDETLSISMRQADKLI